MKEDFFSKFKDYNKELEKILEKKDFTKDTKNLLLSMFYKLEVSYNDYLIVKRKCKTKQEYIYNVLQNIKTSNKIELIKPTDKEFQDIKEQNGYIIDFKLKQIKVIANELYLLYAIFELNDFEIKLEEKYNIIRNSMPYLLNMAYAMENIEVLRDFNAWSWNTLISEIKDININLVYQILRISLNLDIFNKISQENNFTDVIEEIIKILENLYDKKTTKDFMNIIFKISIIKYISISDNENKRLQEEKNVLDNELKEIKNKKHYIEKITNQLKSYTDELKNIDLILNDNELLLKEFEERNSKLSEYNKIFSISHLIEKINRERKKVLKKNRTM